MPPSSTRRTRTRKLPENVDRSDGDDADSIATPSRKRKRTTRADVGATSPATEPITDPVKPRTNGRSRKRRGGDAQDISGEVSFEEEDIDSVIRNLRQSKDHVQARVDFANEVHEMNHPEGKQAYAKIAGNGWTFYVEDVRVRIGRPPDDVPRADTVADQGPAENADALVHIDLGPSKLVSRQHAEIRYDEKEGRWYLHVGGRNGLKLDERPIKRGEGEYLNSGSVIDIAETQMMFVTPNEVPLVHPTILAQITASGFNNEDDEDEFGMDPAPEHTRRTPGRLGTNPDSHRPTSKNGGSGPVNGGGKHYMQAGPGSQHDDGGSQANLKTSPSYSRGMMLETMEGVDYSIDSAKDLKPPHSYATLIGMAILSSPEEKLTLSKIYDWIKERYAFYRLAGGGWQNSIRHNLSLNKCFEKVARRTDEPGKGMKWQIVPEYREDFIKKGLQSRNRNGRSSAPTSPFKSSTTTDNRDPFVDDGRPSSSKTNAAFAKTSPGPIPGSTPPLSRSALKQTFTPDRGTTMFSRVVGPEASSPQNGYYQGSPFPLSTRNSKRLNGLTEAAAMAGTPGGPALLMNSDPNDAFATPFITKYAPRLAPPSAAQLPSQFMPMSSPAPFWKYAELANSTPARQTFGSSPIKREPGERGDDLHLGGKQVVDNDDGRRRAMSSSPPPLAPDRSQGSPARGPGHASDKAKPDQQASQMRGKSASSLSTRQTMTPPVTAALTAADGADDDDDEDEEGAGMIDLAKGFQPIGSFHRHMSAGVIRGN